MADADVPITAGSGTKIDTRTVGAGTDEHRQVVVVGDPSTATAVQAVDDTLKAGLTAGATYTATSGTIVNATSTVTTGNIGRAGNLSVFIFGTYAGVNVTFEASPDNTNWFAWPMQREATSAIDLTSGVLTSNSLVAWSTDAPGFSFFRVRATAWTSGTANVVINAGTLPFTPVVSAAIPNALPTGTNSIGQVTANAGTGPFPVSDNAGSLTVDAPVGTPLFARLSDGAAALAGQKTMANSLPVVIASDQSALTPPTLTKGTQGATGHSTQDLKDAGRVNIMWTLNAFVTTAVAETLMTITESRDGAATTTFTSKVVTNGKRIRITSIAWTVMSAGSAPAGAQRERLRIRFNSAGAVTTSSPLQVVLSQTAAQTAKSTVTQNVQFPDGIEFLGDGTKQIGVTLESPDWVTGTTTPVVDLTIFAFEY